MADKTGIEWTDATWNPIVGCSIVSPGCTNCYAMKMAGRIERMSEPRATAGDGRQTHYAGTTKASKAGSVWTGKLALAPEHILTQPLRWKRPRRIFVNSMGDLFHEDVPDSWIDRVFAVIALAPQHTFQVLTKRAARMRAYFAERWQGTVARRVGDLDIPAGPETGRREQIEEACEDLLQRFGLADPDNDHLWTEDGRCKAMQWAWPLPNLWLGVSAEDQRRADERVPDLRATPAAIRFVSAEPLLGDIIFDRRWLDGTSLHCESGHVFPFVSLAALSYRQDPSETFVAPLCGECGADAKAGIAAKVDWIIVGGESGPNARPMHPDWVRSIRDQCAATGVPFFFKQWGEYREFDTGSPAIEQVMSETDHADSVLACAVNPSWLTRDGRHIRSQADLPPEGESGARLIERVGKARAGRLLEGVEHDAMPVIA